MNRYEEYLWNTEYCLAPKEQCVQVGVPVRQWVVHRINSMTNTVTLSDERPDQERVRNRVDEIHTDLFAWMQEQLLRQTR